MGRVYLIDLEQTPTVVKPYYLCRTCRAHITLIEECPVLLLVSTSDPPTKTTYSVLLTQHNTAMVKILRIRNDEILNFLDSPISETASVSEFLSNDEANYSEFTVLEGEGSYIEILGSTKMGRLFLLDFDQRQTVVGLYYICCTCQTHIALVEDRVGTIILDQPPRVFFNKVVNVFMDGPEHHRLRNLYARADVRYADVYCVKCTTRLGTESASTTDPPPRNMALYKYNLQLDKLILKNGGQLLNSVTGQPFAEEPHPNA